MMRIKGPIFRLKEIHNIEQCQSSDHNFKKMKCIRLRSYTKYIIVRYTWRERKDVKVMKVWQNITDVKKKEEPAQDKTDRRRGG